MLLKNNKLLNFNKTNNSLTGFTLIETLVAIFIFTIIMGALFASIVAVYQTYNYTWQQSVAINEARRGIKIMAKEIREAKTGDDGSYLIEKAGDKEFIFYSDIDKDGETERVRYFLGMVNSGNEADECVSFATGGACNVNFSNFFEGDLKSAFISISVEGDFGWAQERAEIFVDGVSLGNICSSGCSDCAGSWQGTAVFDITEYAQDNFLQFSADATSQVDPFCDWIEINHSMKVKFNLSWESENIQGEHQFKKGITNPTSSPVEYPSDQEEISIISSYVRNVPPIFEYFYFDENDQEIKKIEDYPAKLIDTKIMKIFLVVNVNPNKAPNDFELESYVQLRNLKNE